MNKSANSSPHSNKLLAKNTLINFLGQAIPLIFAVLAIPFVIDGLGTERFGVLTIVWIIIGYFGLFDMGIGRATTKFVADIEAKGEQKLSPIIITSLFLLITFGIIGSGLIILLTPLIVNDILNIPQVLIGETENAFYILSISIPFVLGSVGARGALEAQQKFAIVNVIKIPASILNYIAPLLILPFSNSLHFIVIVLVVGRTATFFIYAWYCLKDEYSTNLSDYPILNWIKELMSFGAWIMVSNFISPLMVYMDRFILGAILTMSAVAYYTTPYEVVTRLLIISGSFMGVMFPAFSAFSLESNEKLASVHQKSIRYLTVAIVPLVIFLILSAEPLLYLWLGTEFAVNSTGVLQLLAVGVLVNSIAMVPYTALQAIGRPDITAKLHMVELPIYLLMIWVFTKQMGIEGVALAWVLRVTIDGAMLLYFLHRIVPIIETGWKPFLKKGAVFILVLIAMSFLYQYLYDRYIIIAYAACCSLVWFYLLWDRLLSESEKSTIKKLLMNLKSFLNINGKI